MPGTYYVRTVQHPVFGLYRTTQIAAQVRVEQAYPPQYYPEGTDMASAQVQVLQGGDAAEADFTLKPEPVFRVSGTAFGAANFLSVALNDGGPLSPIPLRFDRATGKFVADMIPAGTSTLEFYSRDEGWNPLFASAQVKVAGSDVDGLQVRLEPGISIPVTVENDTGEVGSSSVQVELRSVNLSLATQSIASGNASPSAALLVSNVRPGIYRVSARAFSGVGSCIGSVTSGNADLLHNNLVIEAGAQIPPIVISLRHDCAQLSGTVKSNGSNAAATVLLIPDGGGEPLAIPTSQDGEYLILNVTPGSYHVYAFSNVDGLEYTNPEALREYSAQEISLEPNQKATLDLPLIERKRD